MSARRIEALRPDDLSAWLALQSAFPDGWSHAALQSELRADGAISLGHWLDDRLVAAVTGRRVLDELSILQVVVATDCRGQGIGRALVEALLARAATAGARSAWLEVRRSNAAAIALYRRCGFRTVGRRPGFYPDGEDATLMSREGAASAER